MRDIKQVPPAAMTAAQRRQEIAALLANGLFRLRAANARAHAEGRPESGFDLGFWVPERVHTDPVKLVHGVAMNAPLYPTPPSVVAQIANLSTLPMTEIKALWLKLFGTAAPSHNRQFLERGLAYRLQEEAFRKVNSELLERNRRRLDALVETGKNTRRDRDYRPVAGTVLTREYRDVLYRVIATAEGQYDFEGRSYPSLSMIAREITGTRWSGPLFFGLKAPAKNKGTPR